LPARTKGTDRRNKKPSRFKTYTISYGWIVNGTTPGIRNRRHEIVDEVILSVMRAPRSYTKEDVVEINCHSGIVNLRKILDLVLKSGARLAQPGEFTKRAYLNGRIDLAQAEAVLDIIQAKTEEALKLGVGQLKGELSLRINDIRGKLLDIFANLEASIDFPEEDIQTRSIKRISKQLSNIGKELTELLNNSSKGKILREGIKVVIVGRPNVGKSSLLNAFLHEERAIVTEIPGTTRDTIEEIVNLDGIPLRFFDTAGIIEPRDLIEKEAIKRSHQMIESADIVLLVLDGTQKIASADKNFIKELKEKIKIIVINKIDLPQKITTSQLKALNGKNKVIKISALKKEGMQKLEKTIIDTVWPNKLDTGADVIVSNVRHINYLRKSFEALERTQSVIDKELPPEFISLEVKQAIASLDAILGKQVEEDLLDKIFSEFCIGK